MKPGVPDGVAIINGLLTGVTEANTLILCRSQLVPLFWTLELKFGVTIVDGDLANHGEPSSLELLRQFAPTIQDCRTLVGICQKFVEPAFQTKVSAFRRTQVIALFVEPVSVNEPRGVVIRFSADCVKKGSFFAHEPNLQEKGKSDAPGNSDTSEWSIRIQQSLSSFTSHAATPSYTGFQIIFLSGESRDEDNNIVGLDAPLRLSRVGAEKDTLLADIAETGLAVGYRL
jgi:hypothetical protein